MIVLVPGLGMPARFYTNFTEALVERGYHCLTLELRGNGISPIRVNRHVDFGYVDLLQDLAALVAHARQKFPGLPLILSGHSLGGQLALLHSACEPKTVDRLLLIAAGSPHYKYYPPRSRWILFLLPWIFRSMVSIFGYYPGRKVGFAGSEARTLMRDWCNLCQRDRFILAGSNTDYSGLLSRLKMPCDSFTFERDQLLPEAAARGLLLRCPQLDVHYENLRGCKACSPDHFNWVNEGKYLLPIFLQRISAVV